MILYYILVPLAWLVFHIGFRVRCEGRENLKKIGTKGCIIAPNHISAIDPVFVVITRFWGQRMTVFAKKELFEINAFLSWFFRCAGAVCVRGTKEEVGVIDDTVKKCQEGGTLLLFPEGTREKEGKFLPLKSGLFVIAAAANVDVVPCRIYYDTPDGKMKLFCKVRVIFGEPMPAAQFAMEGRRDIKNCGRISRPFWMRGVDCKAACPLRHRAAMTERLNLGEYNGNQTCKDCGFLLRRGPRGQADLRSAG